MKSIHTSLTIIAGLCLAATSCSSDNAGAGDNNADAGSVDATGSTSDSGVSDSGQGVPDAFSGEVTALEGHWRANCTQEHPFQFDIQFRGNMYTQGIGFASSVPCDITSVLEIRTSFVVAGESTMPIDTSYAVDLGTDNAIATVRSGAEFFNTISLCGKNDWVVNQDVPDIAILCDDWLTYELFAISEQTLFIGDYNTGTGTTPATRPTALDTATPFLRVSP